MPETPVPGYAWLLYQNTGTAAIPVWALLTGTRDISAPVTMDELDDSSRDSRYKKTLAGMIDLSFTFQLRYHASNTDHGTLIANTLAGTVFEIALMNAAIATSGSVGFRCYVQLFSHSLNLPLGDNTTVDFTAKAAYFDESGEIDPSWYTVP